MAIAQKLTDDNPANTIEQNFLATTHRCLAGLLALAGKLSEAETEGRTALAITQKLTEDLAQDFFLGHLAWSHLDLSHVLFVAGKRAESQAEGRRALAIYQKLTDEHHDTFFLDAMAFSLVYISDGDRLAGRPAEAKSGYERAIALLEPYVQRNPGEPDRRYFLVCAIRRRGLTLAELGDSAGAAAAARRALRLSDRPGPQSVGQLVETACCHAQLAGLAARAESGVSAADREKEARTAIEWLHRAVAMGYRNGNELQTESALHPLRDREDFKRLVKELEAKKPEKQP
jgi:tetratricopeptide (TPR) repeat protein